MHADMGAQGQPLDDPLYDPVYIAFIYGAWAATSWALGQLAGLIVLVGATALLMLKAITTQRVEAERPFMTDFATILLFCAAAIGLGVLGVELWALWSNAVIGALLAATVATAAVVVDGD